MGFPSGSYGKESACNAGNSGLILGLGRSPGEWQPPPVFLPGKSRRQGGLACCRPWGYKEADTTE